MANKLTKILLFSGGSDSVLINSVNDPLVSLFVFKSTRTFSLGK